MKLYLKRFGEQLRNVRKNKGFSQESFALKANIDRSYYGKIERGENNISLETLVTICKALKCQADDILPPIDV